MTFLVINFLGSGWSFGYESEDGSPAIYYWMHKDGTKIISSRHW